MSLSAKATLETILVVDGNEEVLRVVVAILEAKNYKVLAASSANGALKIAEMDGVIHMLISDVDLATMSGPDLGVEMKKIRPHLHVMQISGGREGNLLVLNYGWAYIQKPFVGTKLPRMIRNVLDTPDRSQLGGQEYDTRKDLRSPKPRKNKVRSSGEEPKGTGKSSAKRDV